MYRNTSSMQFKGWSHGTRQHPLQSAETCEADTVILARSILYQRGVYPSEDFKQKKEYGIMLWVSSDDSLNKYLTTVLSQTKGESTRGSRTAPLHPSARSQPGYDLVEKLQLGWRAGSCASWCWSSRTPTRPR